MAEDDLREAIKHDLRVRFGEPPFADHLTLDDLASSFLYVLDKQQRASDTQTSTQPKADGS